MWSKDDNGNWFMENIQINHIKNKKNKYNFFWTKINDIWELTKKEDDYYDENNGNE